MEQNIDQMLNLECEIHRNLSKLRDSIIKYELMSCKAILDDKFFESNANLEEAIDRAIMRANNIHITEEVISEDELMQE